MKINQLLLWLAIVIITLAVSLGTYFYNIATPIATLVWIGWLMLTLVLAYFTAEGKKFYAFAKESKIELQKVVWPNRQETIQITSIVMIMVTLTGFILWGVDSVMLWAIGKITHLG